MTRLSKTEQRVLAGMRLAQRAHDSELEEHGQPFDDVKVGRRLLQSLRGVVRDARICTVSGRKPGEIEVCDALAKLIERGLVEKDTVEGMGGGFTLYALTETTERS